MQKITITLEVTPEQLVKIGEVLQEVNAPVIHKFDGDDTPKNPPKP
jgi:hypothetical protein